MKRNHHSRSGATVRLNPSLCKDSRRIQNMFGRIAPVYDRLNHLLSLNIDKLWRRHAVKQALLSTDRAVLDLACGTGDLTIALRRAAGPKCLVLGADFCLPMLRLAKQKTHALRPSPPFLQADGLRLPCADGSFDLVTIAFGLRNMEDTMVGLREMHRVLRPGGRLAVLEFTTPANPFVRAGYLTYFKGLLPLIGNAVSQSGAYGYLSRSVMDWPNPRGLAQMMTRAGFTHVRWSELSFGIAALHLAEKK